MKRIFQNASLLFLLISCIITTSCKHETHDATVNFDFELSEPVARVAEFRIVTSVKGNIETFSGSNSFSKIFSGSMDKNESGTFMSLSVFLSLKNNYREEILKMSSSELYTFYRNCKFLSDLKVEIDDNPALHINQSDNYNGMPTDGIVTAEIIIKTLEKHSASADSSVPLFALNIEKNGMKWSQFYVWDVWCETLMTPIQ